MALGGSQVTVRPDEAAAHAGTIFPEPGEQTFRAFVADLRAGRPRPRRASSGGRTLFGAPPIRRDPIPRNRCLAPSSIVVTLGCPPHCGFRGEDAFFEGELPRPGV